jgi:hypothetical protein
MNAEVRGFDQIIYTNQYGAFVASVPHRWSGEIEVIVNGMQVSPARKQIPPVTTSIYAYQFTARNANTFLVKGEFLIQNDEPVVVELKGFPETIRMGRIKSLWRNSQQAGQALSHQKLQALLLHLQALAS